MPQTLLCTVTYCTLKMPLNTSATSTNQGEGRERGSSPRSTHSARKRNPIHMNTAGKQTFKKTFLPSHVTFPRGKKQQWGSKCSPLCLVGHIRESGLISPDQDIKRKSTSYGRQLLGQPPLYVAGSVIMDSLVNKLPDLDVGLSCFP